MAASPRIHVAAKLSPDSSVSLDGQQAHHLLHVLRVRAGASIVLFNGDGYNYPGTVENIGRSTLNVRLSEREAGPEKSPLSIILGQGISKNQRMDLAIQKSVELGVTQIVPVVTARTQRHRGKETFDKKRSHWQSIIIAACEQSGRTDIPELLASMSLLEFVQYSKEQGATVFVLDPLAGRDFNQTRPPSNISFLIGPEGGLSREEIASSKELGATQISFGPRILRTETAALSAIAVAQFLWGDLSQP